jgi:ubiquinone/menaquinone biosynthesis C-methylase UbiE
MLLFEKYGLDRCNLGEVFVNSPMTYSDFKKIIRNEASDGHMVLDAGAGTGSDKKIFNNIDIKYKGIDLGVGHKDWDYSEIISANLENLDFVHDNTFHIVMLIQVMEHLKDPKKVLTELNRVGKKGSKIFIAVPQSQSVHQVPYDFYRFTPYGLKYLLESTSYKVLSIRPQLYGDNIANYQRIKWSLDYTYENECLSVFNKFFINLLKYNLLLYKHFLKVLDTKSKRHISPIGYFVIAEKI